MQSTSVMVATGASVADDKETTWRRNLFLSPWFCSLAASEQLPEKFFLIHKIIITRSGQSNGLRAERSKEKRDEHRQV